MNKALKVTKYQLMDTIRAGAIFYGVILAVMLLASLPLVLPSGGERGTMNGMEFATVIFLFVVGLNSFKSSFRFSLTNSVTRRDFYLGTALSFLVLAAAFTLIDIAVYAVFHGIGTIRSNLFNDFYDGYGGWARLVGVVWSGALNLLALTGGWLITTAFYRANKGVKIALALSPVALQFVLAFLIRWIPGFYDALSKAWLLVSGFGTMNAQVATLSMTVASLLCLGVTWLLARRAAVK